MYYYLIMDTNTYISKFSGKDLILREESYDMLDLNSNWVTVGKLTQKVSTYQFDFEICPFTTGHKFIPMDEWNNGPIFRVTLGTPTSNRQLNSTEQFEREINNDIISEMNLGNMKECAKKMFVHPKTGKPLTYSEMRMLYG